MTQLSNTMTTQIGVDTVEIERGSSESRFPIQPAPCFRWKDLTDPIIAALLLVPGLPIIGLLVLIVRLNSKGPGLFRQTRVGKDGRVFTMYKIRTMAQDAESRTGPVWTQSGDPRVTKLGRILRKLHLDEIPQLFNVIKGEMGLIGPRPERPEFVAVLAEQVPGYMERLAVRPGVTGLAQINLPPDSDLLSVWRKLQLDLEYIETASFFLDVRMFLCTMTRLLALPGALVMQVFRVERPEPEVPTDIEWILTAENRQLRDAMARSHRGNGDAKSGPERHNGEKLAQAKPK